MISFLRKFLDWRSAKIDKTPEIMHTNINKLDRILIQVYKVIIWQNPMISTLYIVCVNFIFWTIRYLNLKSYGIIFTFLLLLTLEQLWSAHLSKFMLKKGHTGDEDGENTLNSSYSKSEGEFCPVTSMSKFRSFLSSAYERAHRFRQTNPAAFCITTCTCFLLLSAVGNCISSVSSIYALLMLSLTLPGIVVHLLPPHIISSFSHFISSNSKDCNSKESDGDFSYLDDQEVESFLPEATQEALEVLRLAGDPSDRNRSDDEESNDSFSKSIGGETNEDTESISSKLSFYPDSSVMPSLEHSMEFLEAELPAENFSNSARVGNESVGFVSKHFDGSSSEEEFALESKSGEGSGKTYFNQSELNKKDRNIRVTNSSDENRKLIEVKKRESGELSSDTDSFEMIEDM